MKIEAVWPWRLVLLLVVLAPLPLGSNRPWAWSLAALVAAIALVGWASLVARGRIPSFWRPALWPVVGGFALVLAWAFIQCLPIPEAFAHPLWPMTADALGRAVHGSISIAPAAAGPAMLRLASYGAIFWLALQYGRDRDRARELFVWVAAASAAYAIYGLANYAAGNRLLLWYPRWAYVEDVTATFVNRNSYAAYAALGLSVSTALGVTSFAARWRQSDRSQARGGRILEALIGGPLIYAFIAVAIAMAWMQTHSRMGFLSGAVSLMALIAILGRHASINAWRQLRITAAIVFLVVVAVSGNRLVARIISNDVIDRAPLFGDVARAIGDAPLTGTGYGSFPHVFAGIRGAGTAGASDITEAHNVYMETALELGIPMATLLLAIPLLVGMLCLFGVKQRRRDIAYPAVAACATVQLAIHSLLDFAPQIPAVAMTYAAILGVGFAQSSAADPLRPERRR